MISTIALKSAEESYRVKTVEGKCGSNSLFSAGWTVEELQKLLKDHQEITVNLSTLQDLLETDDTSSAARNLTNIRQQLTDFIRSLSRHKRTAASNVYVLMISSEQRRVKPYAIPIQLLPYKSINEDTMRILVRAVLKVMKSLGMKAIGKCE